MAADVRFGHLPAYGEPILLTRCAVFICSPFAASAGAPVDIQGRYSTVRFPALVTDVESECMSVLARHFIIERGVVSERMPDDQVAEYPPIVHVFPIKLRDTFLMRIILSRTGCAISDLRRRM